MPSTLPAFVAQIADRPHGVRQQAVVGPRDGDRDLADAEHVEHRELAGERGDPAAGEWLERQRPGVGRLAPAASNAEGLRHHRARQR
jgi:hypothetical protein